MTLTATTQKSFSLTPTALICLALGGLTLLAYYLLTFVTQADLGATSIPTLIASRSNNEVGLTTNGLALIPFAAWLSIFAGLWNLSNSQVSRAAAAVTALAGVLVLEYFIVFGLDYRAEAASYLGQMGPGFWLLLVLGIIMIGQLAVPRATVAKEFQLRSIIANQESAIIIALVVLLVVIGISSPRFLASRNLLDILSGNAYIAVAAIGMSMLIITGNIDISVGSLIGLLAVVSGRMAVGGAPIWLAWLAPLVLGALIGLLIGLIVTYLRVPSIVVTLGMFSILKGALILWTSGQRVTGMPEGFYLAQTKPLGMPMSIWFMLIFTVLAALWMYYSAAGRSLYAVGGNAEAARLSGISSSRVVIMAFVLNGVFVGLASVLYATQLQVIQATPPPGLELAIITAAVVGGVSILGGKGTVIGAMLAAILLNMIRSGMIFVNVSPFWILAVQGILILVTVLIDLLRRRRQML